MSLYNIESNGKSYPATLIYVVLKEVLNSEFLSPIPGALRILGNPIIPTIYR